MRRSALSLVMISGLLATAPTLVAAPDTVAGRDLAQSLCGACHATGRQGASPDTQAMPFRDLHKSYPVEDLAESLAEGMVTGHSNMPEFQLTPQAIDDLIAYLQTL